MALSERGLPMIASQLTADDLSWAGPGRGVDGLVRVAPTNSDEARAVAAYLKRNPDIRRALLIQDTNPADLYAQTLGTAFRRAFSDDAHVLLPRVEEYNGALPGVANVFALMLPNICQARPDVIYFAGRSGDLQAFVEALAGRVCPDHPFNVVTADSGVRLAGGPLGRGQVHWHSNVGSKPAQHSDTPGSPIPTLGNGRDASPKTRSSASAKAS